MEKTAIALFFVLLSSIPNAVGQNRDPGNQSDCFFAGLSYPNVYEGAVYVCPADVKSDPKWDERATKRVPLDIYEAIRRSRRAVQAFEPAEKRWELGEVSFVKVDDEHWVYLVRWVIPESNKSLSIGVTLSGNIIRPQLDKRP